MYARMSIFEGSPDQLDEGLRQAREEVLPRAKQMEGFKDMIALGDRQSGKTLGITFWESEEESRSRSCVTFPAAATTICAGW